jgi:RNA polymerase sigma-70 factor (ECF subfamily)
MAEFVSGDNGPLAEVQRDELAVQLREALAELPERQSQVYCLRHLNGLSYEQIAVEMEMTITSVGVTLHRATERLRAVLTPILSEERNRR